MTIKHISHNFPTIGIIGGGQLGKMISQEAKKMNFRVIILDPTPECPAASVSDEQIVADFKDIVAIKNLAEKSDIITYEIELANTDVLKELQKNGCIVNPSPHTLSIIQNKFVQKTHLKNNNLPVVDFVKIGSIEDMYAVGGEFGFPFILKASCDAYDGRGNIVIHNAEEIPIAFAKFEERDMYAEKFLDFEKEISVMVARNPSGDIECFPVVENIHMDNILVMTIAPARIPEKLQEVAKELAIKTMRVLDGGGIFGIEMFVTKNDIILINEIAPRPHNSGHYSIEACNISQFEQHLRAVADLPLGKVSLLSPAVMINILGDKTGSAKITGIQDVLKMSNVSLHIYGKKVSKPQRKMGHITVLDKDIYNAMEKAKKARSALNVCGCENET